MAIITHNITPPTLEASPFIDVEVIMTGVDYFYVNAGWWEAIPQIYRVIGCHLNLITSADVANRQARIQCQRNLGTGNNYAYKHYKTANVAASQNVHIGISGLIAAKGSATEGWDHAWTLQENDLLIKGDDRALLYIYSGEAADSVVGWFRLEYLNRKYGIKTPYNE